MNSPTEPYFEAGNLPTDRAILYRLCVEGLLYNWDQRRGIRAEFTSDEKLRTCREVALAMQADDKAEWTAAQVLKMFSVVLKNKRRAQALLEHIRYRSGLLVERRPNVFAFAHLTFQEYLAARAVHEGNRLGVSPDRLAKEHADGRWTEVIALYCALAPAPAARSLIQLLVAHAGTPHLARILAEAFLSSSVEIRDDERLRKTVLKRLAEAAEGDEEPLFRFGVDEVALATNTALGARSDDARNHYLSAAFRWLQTHPNAIDWNVVARRLRTWRDLGSIGLSELMYIAHAFGPDEVLAQQTSDPDVYAAPGAKLQQNLVYDPMGFLALIGLGTTYRGDRVVARSVHSASQARVAAFVQALRACAVRQRISFSVHELLSSLEYLTSPVWIESLYRDGVATEVAQLWRAMAEHVAAAGSSEDEQRLRDGLRIAVEKISDVPRQPVNAASRSERRIIPASPRKPKSTGRKESQS